MSENLSREQWGQRGWKSVEITTRALFPDCVARLGEQRACYREVFGSVPPRRLHGKRTRSKVLLFSRRNVRKERSRLVSALFRSPFAFFLSEKRIDYRRREKAECRRFVCSIEGRIVFRDEMRNIGTIVKISRNEVTKGALFYS